MSHRSAPPTSLVWGSRTLSWGCPGHQHLGGTWSRAGTSPESEPRVPQAMLGPKDAVPEEGPGAKGRWPTASQPRGRPANYTHVLKGTYCQVKKQQFKVTYGRAPVINVNTEVWKEPPTLHHCLLTVLGSSNGAREHSDAPLYFSPCSAMSLYFSTIRKK